MLASGVLFPAAMVRLSVRLMARPGQARSLAAALRQLLAEARRARACVGHHLSTDVSDSDTLHYSEEWFTEPDFRSQIGTARFQRLIAVMEAAAEPPQFEVQIISRSYGLDYVAAVLRGSSS
jgi:quinol monooxygenase YgiN